MKEERIGKYCKLYSMIINSIKHYCIGCIGKNGFIRISAGIDKEEAIEEFERIENYAEKHGEIVTLSIYRQDKKEGLCHE